MTWEQFEKRYKGRDFFNVILDNLTSMVIRCDRGIVCAAQVRGGLLLVRYNINIEMAAKV